MSKSDDAARRHGWGLFAVSFGVIAIVASLGVAGCGSKATAPRNVPSTQAPTSRATVAQPADNAVNVRLVDLKIDVSAGLPRGKVTFHIVNAGKMEHELLVFHTSIPPKRFPTTSDGAVNEDAPGMNKISDGPNIAPGHTQQRVVDFAQPGTYVLLCNLPGHYQAGMYRVVTVR